MGDIDIEVKGVEDVVKAIEAVEKEFPKKVQPLINKQAKILRDKIKDNTYKIVNEHSGKLKDRVIVRKKDTSLKEYQRVVSSTAPHAHLIEYGHAIKGHRGKGPNRRRRGHTKLLTKNRARAFKIVEKSAAGANVGYEKAVEEMVNKLIEKLK